MTPAEENIAWILNIIDRKLDLMEFYASRMPALTGHPLIPAATVDQRVVRLDRIIARLEANRNLLADRRAERPGTNGDRTANASIAKTPLRQQVPQR